VSLLNDTNVWYAVAVVLCVFILVKFARKGILAAIDGQIASIKHELDEAQRLRAEAETALLDYQARQSEAMKEAETIVADAKALAAKLRRESELELEETLRRHEHMAEERIKNAQAEVEAEIRNYMMTEAMAMARKKLEAQAGSADAAKLVDAVIADLPKMAGSR
ncbi:MAG: F0F1 ATP synthase subunit B, partial [Bdellovibrionales bacterium]